MSINIREMLQGLFQELRQANPRVSAQEFEKIERKITKK